MSWCKKEHFEAMYESVYKAAVEAGIAKKLQEPVFRDRMGNIVDKEEDAFGLKSAYEITCLEYFLMADETGCNTNQKADGCAGGELFVVPVGEQNSHGIAGATTDMHFTVVPFTSGTGKAVLCAIIIKSAKDVSKLDFTWKCGIDITKPANTGETRVEILENNMGEGKMISEGPACFFNGKKYLVSLDAHPRQALPARYLPTFLDTWMKLVFTSGRRL